LALSELNSLISQQNQIIISIVILKKRIPLKTVKNPGDIDKYISNFPVSVQAKLEELRATVRKAAPEAEEKISYSMPAFALKGILVYFAAHKNHIGFYPTSLPIKVFKEELAEYKWSKGAIRFPFDKPLPLSLISRIVAFRVKENLGKAELKSKKLKR
jgi:uncharacterized protein YdhG (YjbR/CyaY superfamily)